MTAQLFSNLAIFVLSLLVGFEVISKIPTTLHTPMMSGANAIHGVVIAGSIAIASEANSPAGYVLTFVAAALAAANVCGGFVVTDRMLRMFTRPKLAAPVTVAASAPATATSSIAPALAPTKKDAS